MKKGLVASLATVGMVGALLVAQSQIATGAPEPGTAKTSYREAIVKVAKGELTSVQWKGGDGRKDTRRIKGTDSCNKYTRYWDKPCQPWCADFAKYVWRKTGKVKSGQRLNSLASSFRDYGRHHGTYRARGKNADPKPGDAVMFDWNGNGGIDHVAIVVYVTKKRIQTIGGNEGGVVSGAVVDYKYHGRAYKRGDNRIVGFTSPVKR